MTFNRLVFRLHAIQRMFERRVSEQDLRQVLRTAIVIEDYPDDTPYPSRLILGWSGPRPLHVVAADSAQSQETIVITVYEPNLAEWEPDFRTRRRP